LSSIFGTRCTDDAHLFVCDHVYFFLIVFEQSLPGYYSVVKNPICFKDIRTKAKDLKYEALLGRLGVERDLKLMCDNAKRFNAVGSAIWLAAEVFLHYPSSPQYPPF